MFLGGHCGSPDGSSGAPAEQPRISVSGVLSWMGTLALEQDVDEQREMIGTDVARAFQFAEGETVGDEDVIQGPAETCRQVRIEGGKEAAPDPRVPQCGGLPELPGRPRPCHVIQVTGQNSRPTLPPNLPGNERELGVTIAGIVAGPGRPWMHAMELHVIARRQSNPCGD